MSKARPIILSFKDALRKKHEEAKQADDAGLVELSLAEDPDAVASIVFATIDAMQYLGILSEFAGQRPAGFVQGNTYATTRAEHQIDSTEELATLLRQGKGLWNSHPQFYTAIFHLLSAHIRRGTNPGPRLAEMDGE